MAKQTPPDIFTITVRPVYGRSAQMPTANNFIATLTSLYERDVQFKRASKTLALQAALDYATEHAIEVSNRALIEARIREGNLS